MSGEHTPDEGTIRLGIAGPRTFMAGSMFSDDERAAAVTRALAATDIPISEIEVVISGRCGINMGGSVVGGDRAGEVWAIEADVDVEPYPAQWDKHGKRAGPLRNERMAVAATHFLVFWNGRSRGSRSMIEHAREVLADDRVYIFAYPPEGADTIPDRHQPCVVE